VARRITMTVAGVVALGSVAWGIQAVTAGASSPAGGTENFYIAITGNNTSGPIVATGAFTDAGIDKQLSGNGGNFDRATFPKGSFQIDHHAVTVPFNIDRTSCAVIENGSGAVTLTKGTGIYAGIKGTINATLYLYYVVKRNAKGCNTNVAPLGGFSIVSANGTVSFGH
jgi:hypothetical protein